MSIIKSYDLSLWQHFCNSGKGFSFAIDLISVSGTSEVPFILYRHPANTTTLVRFNEIIMNFIPNNANQHTIFRFYRSPVVTDNGTPISVFKIDPDQSATNKCQVFSGPSVSSNGTLITLFSTSIGSIDRNQELSRFIKPGRDLLVTVHPGTSGLLHSYVSSFAEA